MSPIIDAARVTDSQSNNADVVSKPVGRMDQVFSHQVQPQLHSQPELCPSLHGNEFEQLLSPTRDDQPVVQVTETKLQNEAENKITLTGSLTAIKIPRNKLRQFHKDRKLTY